MRKKCYLCSENIFDMKKFYLFLCAAVMLAMTGCGNEPEPEPEATRLNFYDAGFYAGDACDGVGQETDFWLLTEGLEHWWNDDVEVYEGSGEMIDLFVLSDEKSADFFPRAAVYPVKKAYEAMSVVAGWDVLEEIMPGMSPGLQLDGSKIHVIENGEEVRYEFIVDGTVEFSGNAQNGKIVMKIETEDADGNRREREYVFEGKSNIVDRSGEYPG